MADISWIKLSTGMFNNRKIKLIRKMPDGNALIVIWLQLLILAGDINDSGYIYITKEIPYTVDTLATEFDFPIATVQLALNTFQTFGMIETVDNLLHVSSWERYQNIEGMEKVREQNRIRKQNQRKREKEQALLPEYSECNVTSRDSHATDKNRIDKNRIDTVSLCDEKFNEFWREYPRKDNKTTARRVYKKAMKSGDISEAILYGLRQYKQSEQWNRDEGKYIPMAATWLNQCRWEDYADQQEPEQKPNEPKQLPDWIMQ